VLELGERHRHDLRAGREEVRARREVAATLGPPDRGAQPPADAIPSDR
jgi:hypothetical protein